MSNYNKLIILLTIVSHIYCNNFAKKDDKKSSRLCGKHEAMLNCGTDCGQTCDDISKKVVKCAKECKRGCFCVEGFVRDNKRKGRCVRPFECTSMSTKIAFMNSKRMTICGENEEFKCGSDCGRHCDDIFRPGVKCGTTCDSGCYCKDGFYRAGRPNGQCVKEKYCKRREQKKMFRRKQFAHWLQKHFSSKT